MNETIVKIHGSICIISIMPELDATSSGSLEKTFNDLLAQGHTQWVCDFSATTYLSSAGLRVLLSALKQLQKQSGKMVMAAVSHDMQEIFDITSITQLFVFHPTTDDAVAFLQKQS